MRQVGESDTSWKKWYRRGRNNGREERRRGSNRCFVGDAKQP
jgi:hypothetical protein